MSHTSNVLSVRPIDDRLNEAELGELRRKLAALGVKRLPAGGVDVEELFGDVDDGALDELTERLSRSGIQGDIFLPVAFDGSFELRGVCWSSAHALLKGLDGLRSELGLDDEEDDRDRRLVKQRNLWRRFRRGAKLAIKRGLILGLVRS